MTTILDDYTARSSQELTVSKGQHVRVIQKQPPNAPDWCLIRLLNDHHHHPHQQNQSIPSSLAASSTTIASGSIDLNSTTPSKYIEGLVPAAILKSTKSSSSNIQLPPPLSLSITSNKSEQSKNNMTESLFFFFNRNFNNFLLSYIYSRNILIFCNQISSRNVRESN